MRRKVLIQKALESRLVLSLAACRREGKGRTGVRGMAEQVPRSVRAGCGAGRVWAAGDEKLWRAQGCERAGNIEGMSEEQSSRDEARGFLRCHRPYIGHWVVEDDGNSG